MVGGRDYTDNKFNIALRSQRAAGTGFLPFVYAAAFADGLVSRGPRGGRTAGRQPGDDRRAGGHPRGMGRGIEYQCAPGHDSGAAGARPVEARGDLQGRRARRAGQDRGAGTGLRHGDIQRHGSACRPPCSGKPKPLWGISASPTPPSRMAANGRSNCSLSAVSSTTSKRKSCASIRKEASPWKPWIRWPPTRHGRPLREALDNGTGAQARSEYGLRQGRIRRQDIDGLQLHRQLVHRLVRQADLRRVVRI